MLKREIHTCQCRNCKQSDNNSDRAHHQQMNLLLSRLDEQQRRWYAAVEADKIGRGGIHLLSLITGLDEKTIARGQQEMADGLNSRPVERVREPGGGRPYAEKKTPR